jgi:rod shape determining protein RodA
VKRYISFRDFDWLLLALVLLICALGVVQIYSATHNTRYAGAHEKQVYWVLIGMALMFVVSRINYQFLIEQSPVLYAVSLFSLISVLALGQKYMGARRWVKLGSMHFQPSEWVKLVLILAVAKYWADSRGRECTWPDLIKAGLLVGVPCLLVLAQPDLGTALTYITVIAMGLFLGGLRFKQGMVLVLMAGMLMPVAWKVLKPYQRDRLVSFMDPEADYHGSGYQVIQSLIAVGSGGLTGKGLLQGSQSALQFLPVPQTDFIFAAFAEEHGFIGAIGLLLLYFLVLMRLIYNAQTAPDRAGGFVVMGVVAVLVFHILVNVGMVVGFMPVTGIPLPLMSYGGSSVVFMFLALGLVMNIRMRRFVN